MMNQVLFSEDVVNTVRSFCRINEGDDATIALILAIGAELLDISSDAMYDLI